MNTPRHTQIEKIKAFYAEGDRLTNDQRISFVQPSMDLIDDYGSLKQIALIRHGEPALNKKGWFTRTEAIQFIHDYDSVGVEPIHDMPFVLHRGDMRIIHTSTLNRAKHTARLIFGDNAVYNADPLFREFERKIVAFPNIKMPLKFWLLSARLTWLLGVNDAAIESYKEAKRRAQEASEKLIQYAEEDPKVVLVAHGFLNRQLVKNLKKKGWTLVRKGGSDYLATSLLVKIN